MKVRILNNYRVVYKPEHPTSMKSDNWDGWVYEHIFVMENALGRSLLDNEVVHHLDCNPQNNRKDNLIVMDRGMHSKLHFWIDTGAFIHESYERNRMNSVKSKVTKPKTCSVCEMTIQNKQKKFCSEECYNLDKRSKSKSPSKEVLEEDIKTLSWLAIGRKYNVSDNAARKWAKGYGLL